MSGAADGMADWEAVRKARRAYRLLFLLGILLYAAYRLLWTPGGAVGHIPLSAFEFVGLILSAAFLYYFLKTAALLGYSGISLLGIALLCLLPLVDLCAVVILDLKMGALIGRQERIEVCHDAAAGETVAPVRVRLVPRLLWSALVGLLVLAVAIPVAFSQYRDSAIRTPQVATLRDIGKLQAAIEVYREEQGVLPQTLRDLPSTISEDGGGAPVDAWERPLRYSTDGASYRIVSYGYDGEPGGTGLDYDLSDQDIGHEQASSVGGRYAAGLPAETQPTFRQFATDDGRIYTARGYLHGSGLRMVLGSLLAAIAGFTVSFLHLGNQWSARSRSRPLAITFFATVAAAAYMAIMIGGLHLPSGH